jgi:hypothetical protein
MKVGDVVKAVDWMASGGFAVPDEHTGIIVGLIGDVAPPLLEIMLPSGEILVEYEDEIEVVFE